MKAKLIVNDREIEVEISEEEFKTLVGPKKTGYEAAPLNDKYYYDFCGNNILSCVESGHKSDHVLYDTANYYSDKTIAENNARADRLIRNLRRFSVNHRETKIDWGNANQKKYFIFYHHDDQKILSDYNYIEQDAFMIYFDSDEAAIEAIEAYHDELMWYFTEYKDSL